MFIVSIEIIGENMFVFVWDSPNHCPM